MHDRLVDGPLVCSVRRMKVVVGAMCVYRGQEGLICVMHDLICVPSLSISYFPIGKKGLATRTNSMAKVNACLTILQIMNMT